MRFQLVLKRSIDITVAFIALLSLVPIMIVVAVLVKVSSPGPVFFVQNRVGLNKKGFKIFKFRTMMLGAADVRNGLAVAKGDARVTWIGKYLRKTSLDEIPQFINVLIGDISLVGPRPMLPEQLRYLKKCHLKRFDVRPGITGLATVNGRCSIPWSKRLEYDAKYVDQVGLWLDIKILFKTVLVVLSGEGTYYDSTRGPAFDLADPNDLPQSNSGDDKADLDGNS